MLTLEHQHLLAVTAMASNRLRASAASTISTIGLTMLACARQGRLLVNGTTVRAQLPTMK